MKTRSGLNFEHPPPGPRPRTFKPFTRLPPELRRIIWQMNLGSVLLYIVRPDSIRFQWPDDDGHLNLPSRNRGRLLYLQSLKTHRFLVYWTKPMNPVGLACQEARAAIRSFFSAEVSDDDSLPRWFCLGMDRICGTDAMLRSIQSKPWFSQVQHVEVEIDGSSAYYVGDYVQSQTPFLWAEPKLKRLQTLTIVFSRAYTYDQVIQDAQMMLEGSKRHWLCNWWVRYDGWYDPPAGRPKAPFYARVISCDTGPEEWLTPENHKEKRTQLNRQLDEFQAVSAWRHVLYHILWDYQRNPPEIVGWDLITDDDL